MQMIVLIVFALVLSFAPEGGPRLADVGIAGVDAGWGAISVGVVAYLAGTALLTWWVTRRAIRRLIEGVDSFTLVVRRHHRSLALVQLWLVVGIACLIVAGAADVLGTLTVVARIPLAQEALMVAFFFIAAVLFWRISYRFDRAVRWQVEQDLMLAGLPVRAGWTSREHLGYNIRHHFLFVAVPVGLIMFSHELVDLLVPTVAPAGWVTVESVAAKALATGVIFFISPLLLVRVWRTRPMPPGELRDRLDRLCRKIGLKHRGILIWDTGGVVANAAVMGMHRSVRYILISDALLEQMDDQQIVAVFGHEAGHVKQRHMRYFLVFMVTVMLATMAIVSLGGMLAERAGVPRQWVWLGEEIAMLVVLMAMMWQGFGWLSRRFERQADIYGAWCAGLDAEAEGAQAYPSTDLGLGAPWFITALENIARLNGLPRDGRNWRHGSIASRVNFLADWVRAGLSRADFDRGVAQVKRIGLAIGAGAILAAVLTWPRWWE